MTAEPRPSSPTRNPYGPRTKQVRDFLVRFAGLGSRARADVVARYETLSATPEFAAAESVIGETIARAGLIDARDALAGPLLQLVRAADRSSLHAPEDEPLDPIAEPALAALLALLTEELVEAHVTRQLYSPFEDALPR